LCDSDGLHLEHLSDPSGEKNPIPHDTHFIFRFRIRSIL